jgi:tRNA A37 methylthiotransferase MiaB
MVSLGCPKALVDSERILTRLRADGYAMSPDYAGADVVVVNTCGFLDSAKEESLEAIGEAIALSWLKPHARNPASWRPCTVRSRAAPGKGR